MRFRQRILFSLCSFITVSYVLYTLNVQDTPVKPLVDQPNEVKHTTALEYLGLQLRSNVGSNVKVCPIPDLVQNGWPWPKCTEKVDRLTKHWQKDSCYAAEGVNGSVCSVLAYLTNKERYCPPSEQNHTATISTGMKLKNPEINFTALIERLSERSDFLWMLNRISLMQPLWVQRAQELYEKKSFTPTKKRIHIHLGLMELGMGRNTHKGGAMGELLQWSDVIASLYVLGHSLDITSTKSDVIRIYSKYLVAASKSECVGQSLSSFKYDLVYTDIRGFKILSKFLPKFENIKCRMRILDSFGTEAPFNVRDADELNPFGGLKLLLPQFNTMFPHSPDNTFMGFVIEPFTQPEEDRPKRRDLVLVYGKDGSYWNGTRRYLDLIHDYFGEMHATVAGDLTNIPEYVINQGILTTDALHSILRKTRLFVGLGFPFEGPAPLEAIAHGAVFLNPMFDDPVSAKNHIFFKKKPTQRALRYQNPYVQDYIGEPYSYAVNMTDHESVINVLKRILRKGQSPGYLPFEFSVKGMLERVSVLVEKQNFCWSGDASKNHEVWPPEESLIIRTGRDSCTKICERLNLICEPLLFPLVNIKSAFEKAGMPCNFVHYPNQPQMGYPAYAEREKACCIQTHYHYFSCSHEIPAGVIRLCPCRDYQKGQIALSVKTAEKDL